MPSPTTSSSTSNVGLSHTLSIDALLGTTKWGGAVGTGTSLGFSFPWASSSIANFAEWDEATHKWSAVSETTSSSHFGLNVEQQAAARSALLSWSSVANIGAYEVKESSSNVGDIRFTWTNDQSYGDAWGWASYPWNQPSGGDVWLNANIDSATESWAIGSWNYEALLHEIGHALGLKHPFDDDVVLPASQDNAQYTVMAYDEAPYGLYYTSDGQYWTGYYVSPETPMVFDIAAIQYLYGANMTYHTGDDIYTFDPATPFLKSIWDAAGSDTVSASNFTLPCRIDLTPGSYSSLGFALPSVAGATYDGTENLGIAYGCFVENAQGGSGSDTLIGNIANNVLNGGAGNDTLDGGGGSDSVIYANATAGVNVNLALGVARGDASVGTDTLVSIEVVTGSRFADTLTGSNNDNKFFGMGGNDLIDGQEGNDTVSYWDDSAGVTVNLATGSASDGFGSTDTLINIENIGGSNLYNDNLTGNALANEIDGFGGNDTLKGMGGNDSLYGGSGRDTAVFSGTRASYTMAIIPSGWTVSSAADGADSLFGIERLQFYDKTLAFDIDGNAGQAYRLYQAAFNRTPDVSGLTYQTHALDDGWGLSAIAKNFIDSPEFSRTYGSLNNTQFVTQLYQNVLHRFPDAGGLQYHVDHLNQGWARENVLVGFSESPENQVAVIGAIQNGIELIG